MSARAWQAVQPGNNDLTARMLLMDLQDFCQIKPRFENFLRRMQIILTIHLTIQGKWSILILYPHLYDERKDFTMKKFVALLLALLLALPMVALGEAVPSPSADAVEVPEVKIGQVLYAAHGEKCFAVITVAVIGDTIVAAHIEEFQYMDASTAVGVPNSDKSFGTAFPEGKVLASKRENNDLYSANMANAGSTVALVDNYTIIEDFVVGMTIAELEAVLAGKTAEEMVDAVSGATLVDTLGYLQGILAAAKAAK